MQLLIVDTAQIQPYIFGSNRLRENIGASYLVAQATGEWALNEIKKLNSNVLDPVEGALDDAKHIDEHGLEAEVLYAGGGNVVVLFDDDERLSARDRAKDFTRALSQKVLQEAPGLQLVIEHQPFDWKDSLYAAVQDTFYKLNRRNRARVQSTPLLGSSVTTACRSTGQPAVGYTTMIKKDITSVYPASAETLAKFDLTLLRDRQESDVDARLRRIVPLPDNRPELAYPADFDDLGRTAGEHSYLAVVHADGNSMSQRIRTIGEATGWNNRRYIDEMRAFSRLINSAARQALRDTVDALVGHIGEKPDAPHAIVHAAEGNEIARVDLAQVKDEPTGEPIEPAQWYVPFRPIVFGGDDVTFVCDGRLGISLALKYLRKFEEYTDALSDHQGSATACAGIAIVKTHYPFARAYTLAEELCGSAKDFRRRHNLSGGCLDWHFALSGLAGDIDEIRQREYDTAHGSLTQRPVTLETVTGYEVHSWDVIWAGVQAFQGSGWSTRRNKIKALRDALREGGEAVEHFRMKFLEQEKTRQREELPAVGLSEAFRQRGWDDGVCGYFDAIELADWFVPTEG